MRASPTPARGSGLDALDTAVLGLCAAPELHPRYGRLFAYLHDDVTRRLASPRLVAELLTGYAHCRPTRSARSRPRVGAAARGRAAGDRGRGQHAARRPRGQGRRRARGVPARARRAARPAQAAAACGASPCQPKSPGRDESVAEIAGFLAAVDAGLPLVVDGAGRRGAGGARAAGRPLLLTDVRELSKPELMADAALCCALDGRLLCGDGLERLQPTERTALLRALDEHPEQLVLLAPTRAGALTLGDRTVLLVEVPMPNFAEREAAWSELTGARRHARRQREVPALAVPDAVGGRGRDAHRALAERQCARARRPGAHGARQASSTRLGTLATRLAPSYGWDDLVLPAREIERIRAVSAYLRHRDRVLLEWGFEG